MTDQTNQAAARKTEDLGSLWHRQLVEEMTDRREQVRQAAEKCRKGGEYRAQLEQHADRYDRMLAALSASQPAGTEREILTRLCDQLDGMKRTMFLRPGTGQHYSYLVQEDVAAYVEQARAAPLQPAPQEEKHGQ